MYKFCFVVLTACMLSLPVIGCSQSRVSSTNSASQLSGQEFRQFGDALVGNLRQNGVLDRNRIAYGRMPVIMWSRFVNSTDDPQMGRGYKFMYNSLEEAMVNSGEGTVTSAIGGSDVRNPDAGGDLRQFGVEVDPLNPTLIMEVEVVSTKVRGNRGTQYDYDAKVTLIDVKTSTKVWIGRIPMTTKVFRGR